jgi:hypothetical protein
MIELQKQMKIARRKGLTYEQFAQQSKLDKDMRYQYDRIEIEAPKIKLKNIVYPNMGIV